MNIRPLTIEDRDLIRNLLLEQKINSSKEWVRQFDCSDVDKVSNDIYLENGMTSCIIQDTYLFCYNISKDVAGRHCLCERFLLRISDSDYTISNLFDVMLSIAVINGCSGIELGTSLSNDDELLIEKYSKLGFKTKGVVLRYEMGV